MKITGKVFKKLDKESGLSKSQNYFEKQTLVVNQGETSKVAIEFFGESKCKKLEEVKEGDFVEVTCFIESRPGSPDDAQERWFTQVNGSSISVFRKVESASQTEMDC